MTPKKSKGIGAYLLVVVLLLLGVFFITQNIGGKENDTQYSEIMNYFDDYDVKKYTLGKWTAENDPARQPHHHL